MSQISATRTNAILLVVLLFAQLLLMSGSSRNARTTSVLRSWVSEATSPIVTLASTIGGGVASLVGGVGKLLDADARNRRLEREIGRLRTELRRSRDAAGENARLRELLEMRENLAPRSIGATVVTAMFTANEQLIVVDRGETSGVRVDLPVVAWGGAVGRVVGVDSHHAVVRLLTDPNSGVAGIVQGSGAQGMVVGKGSQTLDLLYVPRFSNVIHGDRVETSGLDGIFPRGFGIGEVMDIQEKPDGSQTIRLEPELDFRDVRQVLVLVDPVGGDLLSPRAPEVPL
jgi:rod shape-determining protein MreC